MTFFRLLTIGSVMLLSFTGAAAAKGGGKKGGPVTVRPYTKKDGTHVEGHHRSAPDGSKVNNWSSKGNINPYTGKPGSK